MHLIDSHCHLNFEGLSNRLPEVFANMEEQSVKQALAISVSKQSFAEVFDIAQANEQVYCTIGVHPDSQEAEEFTVAEMVEAAKHPKVVGVGETGLDYYWCKGDLAWQHRRFAEHIQAANESGSERRSNQFRRYPLLHRRYRFCQSRFGFGAVHFLLRHCYLQKCPANSRSCQIHPCGSNAGRNRLPIPRPGPQTR